MLSYSEAKDLSHLPVAIIGAGPIGLAAAAHLLPRGETPLVFEAGDEVGANIRKWAHVRLFSPWKYLVDTASRELLEDSGWTAPDGNHLPTGGEFLEQYLEPLAALSSIAPHIRLGRRVEAITRKGFDKAKSTGREQAPFAVVVRTPSGRTERYLVKAVLDASGTYATPNPLGASGVTVEGEVEVADRVSYGIPDILGAERARFSGRRTLVVGSGHSAFNAILDLTRLAQLEAGTEVVWAVRRKEVGLMFGGGDRDALPARGSLGSRMRDLVSSGAVSLVAGFRADRLVESSRGILVEGEDDMVIGPVDRIIVATGYRPDIGILRELRLSLDPSLEAPEALAPLIDPSEHSCGTVYPHGYDELRQPERDFFLVGMKSYGRAPAFLLLTGYEQVRSVVSALSGDLEGAREVRLVLPETGVCSTDSPDSACCGTAVEGPSPIAGSCGITKACSSDSSRTSSENGSDGQNASSSRGAVACCG